ncbi:MAG: preprotein translocase subunit SecG [Bacilli bacterium]|nr:preprotein translocase subunit SecG [Bacilli bacterium]
MYFLDYILLAISVFLVIIIVIQSPKDDVNKAFSGEKSELFANQKQRGMERVINITTAVLSIAFFVVAFLIAILDRMDFII